MAKTIDTNAEKQRKQKIILAVLGVVLLAIAAIQVPKLLGGSEPTPAVAAEATDTDGTTSGSSASAAATPTAIPVPPGVPRAVLVGVTVGFAGRAPAGEGQLRSFTLFKQKDPFMQSLPTETSGATVSTGEPTLSDTEPGGGSAGGGGGSVTAPAPGSPLFATISVNGKDVPLEVKDLFPPKQQLFVLVSVKEKTVKIAVAGGAFTDARTVTLRLGQNLTLVNTATGERYALKLLFVGDQPEEVQGFTQGATPDK